jgi:1,4-dihydroxy-6-naphthoate synthase
MPSRPKKQREKPHTLAYSPCPNDTYIFAALANGLLSGAPKVRVELMDIGHLNKSAEKAQYELTKVSYGAIPHLTGKHRILRAGGGLGHGCGPLLIARPGTGSRLEDFTKRLIGIPGERTTAFMLLQLALGSRPQAVQMRFDRIIASVAAGEVDAGLIIHESRFTFADAGLVQIADLGDWWESITGQPIPLGAILVRNDVADAASLDNAIRRSLAFARANEAAIMPYVREHAVEMSDEVMRKHIALYVNDHSDDIGEDGIAAVRELFARAHAAGIIPGAIDPPFISHDA